MEEKSKYVIVKYFGNWADEMDIEGVEVMLRSDYEQKLKKIKSLIGDDGYVSIYYGTNEDQEYELKEFLSCFDVVDCDDDFAEKFNEKIGKIGFKFSEEIDRLIEYEEEENDDDDDDDDDDE